MKYHLEFTNHPAEGIYTKDAAWWIKREDGDYLGPFPSAIEAKIVMWGMQGRREGGIDESYEAPA